MPKWTAAPPREDDGWDVAGWSWWNYYILRGVSRGASLMRAFTVLYRSVFLPFVVGWMSWWRRWADSGDFLYLSGLGLRGRSLGLCYDGDVD